MVIQENIEYKKNVAKQNKQKEWIEKLEQGFDKHSDENTKNFILSNKPADADSDELKLIEFTIQAVNKMDTMLPEDIKREILINCSCHYPKDRLQELKNLYNQTGNIDKVHQLLEEQFESTLYNPSEFESEFSSVKDEYKQKIIERNWGLAGEKIGDSIIVTKIPNEIERYFTTDDPIEKRYAYCHCPRIKALIKENNRSISESYCYCGAGFYKGIWEEIIGSDVKVEVLETVVGGSSVCKFAVHL